jgi:transposase
MKMPAQIHPWLNDEELAKWVREAPSQDAYKKRLAIWLTRRGPFHAHRVSDLLQVSKQAVWLWIKQYNQGGPESLDRKGRGGRRRAYLSLEEERALVERLQSQVSKGQAKKAKELLPEVLEAVGQNVSVAYVYRLMQRHERRRGPAANGAMGPSRKGANGAAGPERMGTPGGEDASLPNGSFPEQAALQGQAPGGMPPFGSLG